jgi:hypothetical protein
MDEQHNKALREYVLFTGLQNGRPRNRCSLHGGVTDSLFQRPDRAWDNSAARSEDTGTLSAVGKA